MQTEEQVQQNDASKTGKKFDENLNKIRSILGTSSDSLLKSKKKVKSDVISDIVLELTKEKIDQNREVVKQELVTLLDKHIDFEVEVAKKQQELDKLKETKQKEFIEASNKFFGKIEDVEVYANRVAESLKQAAGGQ